MNVRYLRLFHFLHAFEKFLLKYWMKFEIYLKFQFIYFSLQKVKNNAVKMF